MSHTDWVAPALFGFGLSVSVGLLVLHRWRPGHNARVFVLALVAALCVFGLLDLAWEAWLAWAGGKP